MALNKLKINTLLVVLTTIPIGFFLYIIIKYNGDVVCLDEFIFMIPRVQHLFEGNFSFYHDIWAHLNDHRIVFPNIIVLLNARFLAWNLFYEMAIGIVLYFILFIVVIYQLNKTRQNLNVKAANWILPIIALLIFSIIDYMTFAMGFLTIVNSMLVLSASAGLIILSQESFSWYRFCAAFLLGIVAAFSFGAGVVYWPIGFFTLLFLSYKNLKTKRVSIILWIILSSVIIALYSQGFSRPINISNVFNDPFKYMEFVFGYLGAPICNFSLKGAVLAGFMGVVGSFYFGGMLIKRKYVRIVTILPYISLSLFSILNAFLTGIGRIGIGRTDSGMIIVFQNEMLLYRGWKIIATPLWISFIVFLYLFFYYTFYEENIWFKRFKRFNMKKIILAFSTIAIITATLTSYSYSYSNSYTQLLVFYYKKLYVRLGMLTDDPKTISFYMPIIIFTTPEDIKNGIAFLKKNKLAFYRKGGPYYSDRNMEIENTVKRILTIQRKFE